MTLILVLLLLLFSCGERPTRVELQGGNPPTFSLQGSGELDRLSIQEADAEEQPNPTPATLWEIVPLDSGPYGLAGIGVEKIGKVTYGVVPNGYKQVTPSNGNRPAPLVSGKYYYFHFSTVNAPHAWGYFVIRNGKAEFARIHGNCIHEKDGKKFKGPCGDPEY